MNKKDEIMQKKLIICFFLFLTLMLYSCEKEEKYIVEFETDGGDLVDKKIITKYEDYNITVIPIKNEYSFIGWYIDSNLTQKFNIHMDLKNIKLYAKWEKKQFN